MYKDTIFNGKIGKIYLATLEGEYGVYLRNTLQKNIFLQGAPKYRLGATYSLSEEELAIARDDSFVRKKMRVDISFHLTTLDGSKRELTTFKTIGTANFDTQSSPYAIEASKKFAIKRAINVAAQSAIMRLYVFFSSKANDE